MVVGRVEQLWLSSVECRALAVLARAEVTCLGLDADVKPLLSQVATGEFNSQVTVASRARCHRRGWQG
eukprot:1188321-Prorocentrum_minimum.AAC.2